MKVVLLAGGFGSRIRWGGQNFKYALLFIIFLLPIWVNAETEYETEVVNIADFNNNLLNVYAAITPSPTKHYTILVPEGVYDVKSWFSEDYIYNSDPHYNTKGELISGTNTQVRGLVLLDYTKLLGVGSAENIKFRWEQEDGNANHLGYISTLNTHDWNELENLTIIGHNVRYAVHDDPYSFNSRHLRVKNCIFKVSGQTSRAWGGGFHQGEYDGVFENCKFIMDYYAPYDSEADQRESGGSKNYIEPFVLHDYTTNTIKESHISFIDCSFYVPYTKWRFYYDNNWEKVTYDPSYAYYVSNKEDYALNDCVNMESDSSYSYKCISANTQVPPYAKGRPSVALSFVTKPLYATMIGCNLNTYVGINRLVKVTGLDNNLGEERERSAFAFSMPNLQGQKGSLVRLPIELTNNKAVRNCQFDLKLPDGVTVANNNSGNYDVTLSQRAEGDSIFIQSLANGDYRFTVSSMNNNFFSGNKGVLLEATLNIPENMEVGGCQVKIVNSEVGVPEGNDLKVIKYSNFESIESEGDGTMKVKLDNTESNLIINESDVSIDIQKPTFIPTDTFVLPVNMSNKVDITAFQMDVEASNGTTIENVTLGNRATDSHKMSMKVLSDDKVRVVVYSTMNQPFAGSDGALFDIVLKAQNGGGDCIVKLSNIELTGTDGTEYNLLNQTNNFETFLLGDANCDHSVTIADVNSIINYILGEPSSSFNEIAADVNCNGKISITDVVLLINNYILTNSVYNAAKERTNEEDEAILTFADAKTEDNHTLTISIALNKEVQDITSFQCDMVLPEGVRLVENGIKLQSSSNHDIAFKMLDDNKLRMACYSMENEMIASMDNAILTATFQIDRQQAGNEYTFELSNIELATPQAEAIHSANNSISLSTQTGINQQLFDRYKAYSAYSITGMTISREATSSLLTQMPKGIYIINGRKCLGK